jgi:hypothetical protein
MVEYKCIRCNKIYINKYDYNKHLNRKIPCKSKEQAKIIIQSKTINSQSKTIKNLRCNYCEKNFTHSNNLNRHIKTACKVIKENNNNKKIIFDTLINEMNELKEKLTQQEQKNNKLEQEIQSLKKMSKNKIINNSNNKIINTNSHNNITNNIQLIAFGKETMDKIDKKGILKALKKGYFSTVELTDQIHFNPKIPEHHNIYIPNLKDKYTMIYDGNKWNLKLTETVIDDLYDNKKVIIENNINEFQNSLNDSQQLALERWINTPDENKKITNVKEEFKLLLYNKKNIPLATRKINDDNCKELE